MTREELLSSKWVRLIAFIWLIVFPIVFIAIPAVEAFMGDSEQSWTPVWALMVWMMGPWAASIVMKYVSGEQGKTE